MCTQCVHIHELLEFVQSWFLVSDEGDDLLKLGRLEHTVAILITNSKRFLQLRKLYLGKLARLKHSRKQCVNRNACRTDVPAPFFVRVSELACDV